MSVPLYGGSLWLSGDVTANFNIIAFVGDDSVDSKVLVEGDHGDAVQLVEGRLELRVVELLVAIGVLVRHQVSQQTRRLGSLSEGKLVLIDSTFH